MKIPLIVLAMMLSLQVHARNLADLVDETIATKDADIRAKNVAAGAGAPAPQGGAVPAGAPGPGPQPGPSATSEPSVRRLDVDDIKVIGVYGLGQTLNAVMCVRSVTCTRDSALILSAGQTLGGWRIAKVAADRVTIERTKKGSKSPDSRELYLQAPQPIPGQVMNGGQGRLQMDAGQAPTPLVLPPKPIVPNP